MDLLFDGQALQTASRGRGVGRYATNLLDYLHRARPNWHIRVIEAEHLPPIDRRDLPADCEILPLPLPVLPLPNRLNRWLNDRAYGDWLAEQDADAYLSAHSFEKEGVHPLFGPNRLPNAVVLYDLIPQRFEEIYLADRVFCEFYADRLRQTCEADLLLSISDWTARDYGELQPAGPGRIAMIGGAPDPQLGPLSSHLLEEAGKRLRAKFKLKKPFILNPSGQCWRKNSRGALLAFARLPAAVREQYEFVVACRTNRAEEEELRRIAEEYRIGHLLRLTGFVSDEELRALNQLCRLCLFPSFYEGIGLPIIEALQCGAPVVTHDCSSLPEFAGPHSFYADPLDNFTLTAALEKALAEPYGRHEAERRRFAAKFTWEDVAERAAAALEMQLQPLPPRPRLACVTAAAPSSPEMKKFEALVRQLSFHFSVEVVVPDDYLGIRPALQCLAPMLRVRELRERHRMTPFDRFLYDGGDTNSRSLLARLAPKYPGLVLDGSGEAIEGVLAHAVWGADRWARLRPEVAGPLFLLDSDGAESGAPVADRLAEALYATPMASPLND